jgi:hypothetical protein
MAINGNGWKTKAFWTALTIIVLLAGFIGSNVFWNGIKANATEIQTVKFQQQIDYSDLQLQLAAIRSDQRAACVLDSIRDEKIDLILREIRP